MINIGEQIQHWIAPAPDWGAATLCRERIDRFQQRTKSPKSARVPLVVALLGGTGTGKSSLLNAIVGQKIVIEGKNRPTTNEPVLVCHTQADVSFFKHFQIERRENFHLEQMMILDCPDPDTTDDVDRNLSDSNLAKLRSALPFCDIILVTATQQKYRSRRVLDELAAAAPGARLVFVQTHADKDIDIREDWKKSLADQYETGEMFFVNSLLPEEDGSSLQELRQLLTQDLNEEAALRIRQANYFGLAEEAVADCREIIQNDWQPVGKLRERISEERQRFGEQMAEKIKSELIRDRRSWESKLLGRISAQWGYSPFSLLLRFYQGFGSLLSGALLTRVRSPIQLALWGSFESVRRLKKRRTGKKKKLPEFSLEEVNQLKESALILTGFATDARIPAQYCQPSVIQAESKQANEVLLEEISAELETFTDRSVKQCQRLWFRGLYETLFGAMVLFLLIRPAKNFFIDSPFYQAQPLGIDHYFVSLIWLILWGSLLLFFLTMTLRKGIERLIETTSQDWYRLPALDHLFSSLETATTKILAFREELESIKELLDRLNQQSERLDKRLGRKR